MHLVFRRVQASLELCEFVVAATGANSIRVNEVATWLLCLLFRKIARRILDNILAIDL